MSETPPSTSDYSPKYILSKLIYKGYPQSYDILSFMPKDILKQYHFEIHHLAAKENTEKIKKTRV